MRNFFAFLLLIILCSGINAFDIASISTNTKRVEFESGFASYDSKGSIVKLSSSVLVRQVSKDDIIVRTIKSEELTFNADKTLIVMDSTFEINDSTGVIKAASGYYNYSSNQGEIKDGVSYIGRFILRGKKINIKDGSYLYRNASFTTCDLPNPHYRIGAYKINLVPGKYFLAYSTVFYIGKVPVFYFPVIYKPLGKGTPVLSQFYPGYDERNGFYIKSNYIYRFDLYTRFKVFLDYFSKKGFGMGTEIDYYRPEKNITSLSFYRIKEYGEDSQRWGINGGTWHSLKSGAQSAYFQTYARLLSDPKFNNDFFRSNPFAVSSDKQGGAAFTYNTGKTTTRLSYYTKYVSMNSDTGFYKENETVPRLDFNTAQIKMHGLPFLNTWSFYAENIKENTPYYQKRFYGAWNISMPVKIYGTFNFYPEIFYSQNLDISTSSTNSDQWIGHYGTRLNLRKSQHWGSIDISFYSMRRNSINKMQLDRSAYDKGVENQELNYSIFWIKSSNSYLRLSSGYDLKSYDDYKSFKKRMFPLSFETYIGGHGKEIFVYDSYDIDRGNKSFISQLNLGNEKDYFSMGLANYSDDSSKWIVSNGLGFTLPIRGNWRTELILRYCIDSVDKRFNAYFFEKSAVVYKDFHDFRTKFHIRTRRDVKEFFLYITLKMNDPYRSDEVSKKADYFWRPWRKPGENRD